MKKLGHDRDIRHHRKIRNIFTFSGAGQISDAEEAAKKTFLGFLRNYNKVDSLNKKIGSCIGCLKMIMTSLERNFKVRQLRKE